MEEINIKKLQKEIKKLLVDGPLVAAETECHKILKHLISFPH